MFPIEIDVPIYDEKGKIISKKTMRLKDLEMPKTQYEVRKKYGDKVADMFEYQYYLAYSVEDYKDFPKRGVASTLSLIKALTKIATLPPKKFRTQEFWKNSELLPKK